MKKIFRKSNIFAFILGALIFGGIGVVSAYTLLANNIGYTPKDSTWKKSNGEDVTNVKDAIDDLYIKANNNISYDVLLNENGTNNTINYTITEANTNYKSILVVVSTSNFNVDTTSSAHASVSNTNNTISPVFNNDNYIYQDAGMYGFNNLTIFSLNNPIKNDTLTISAYYGFKIVILGVK